MILGSFNIRGGANALKRRRISSIIIKGRADIFFIQETKVVNMCEKVASSFWRSLDIGYSFSNSDGRSGGLITLWKKESVSVICSFRGDGFLGIKASWKNDIYYLVNVYSSCEAAKKTKLWETLLDLKRRFCDGEWIMGGDFNAITNSRERKGRVLSFNSHEADGFAKFILSSGLIDVPCKGKNFSWFSGDGKSKIRIDRFLLSSVVINRWEVVGQFIGDRDISDHCPIWIISDSQNWGPKPFKFNNEWFSSDSFIPFVEDEWNRMVVRGRGDYVLKEKLRLLKDKIKVWNKEVFGKFDLEVEEGVRDINRLDDLLDPSSSSPSSFEDDMVLRKHASCKFWRNLRIKENMLVQRAKLTWIKEGDSNSGFFHKVVNQKRRINHIGPINLREGCWTR